MERPEIVKNGLRLIRCNPNAKRDKKQAHLRMMLWACQEQLRKMEKQLQETKR